MHKIYLLFLLCFLSLRVGAQTPATEVRAVWLTTNWNLDFPSPSLSVEGQKQQLRTILDKLQQLNINTVFFQARVRGDVFYNSQIEPWSPFAKRGFGYLEYAVQECHKRGIECHAWVVTFPVGTKRQATAHGKNSVVNSRRDLCKFHNGEWYLDPGNPETRKYLLNIVNEIVDNYDLDGVHFDYIRYPDKGSSFPDKDTFKKYGQGQAVDNWRRGNITKLVSSIYDAVKEKKPWVQVSSSPIGKYNDLGVRGSSWTAYSSVYQDAAHWLEIGKHDALYPMLYYRGNDFYAYLNDWVSRSSDRLVVPGLGTYQMLASERNWSLDDIRSQIDYTRENKLSGQAHFRAGNILTNTKGIEQELRQYYPHPAKLPAMNWLDSIAPNSPINLEVFRNDKGKLCLKWEPSDTSEKQTYTIYRSSEEEADINKPENIIATGIRSGYIELDADYGEYGLYYSVSASDLYHNESICCFSAYFVHSDTKK